MLATAKQQNKTQEDTNPNAKVEQDLQDSIKRFSSAKTTLSDIKTDLDKSLKQLPERLQGNAYQKAQVKLGKLGDAFSNAEGVFQTGVEKLQKMYDGYIKIDEEQKKREEEEQTREMVMGILLLASLIVPFAIEILGPLCAELMLAFEEAEIASDVASVGTEAADLSEVEEVTFTFDGTESSSTLGEGIDLPPEGESLGTPEGENVESYEINDDFTPNDPNPNGGDTSAASSAPVNGGHVTLSSDADIEEAEWEVENIKALRDEGLASDEDVEQAEQYLEAIKNANRADENINDVELEDIKVLDNDLEYEKDVLKWQNILKTKTNWRFKWW